MTRKIFFIIGLNFLTISVFSCEAHKSNRREDLIQDSVRRLLGVKPGVHRSAAPGKNISSLPPSYVMDLYEKYRSGHTPMQGNTVRSILPMRDTIGEADVLIFNLTGIHSSEQILQSKLYLLKRRKPKNGKKREGSGHFRIKIGTLPHMTSHRYIEVSLSRQKSEWHSYDITESVVHCRQMKQNGDSLLGVTLEAKRPKGSYRLSPFRRLLKQNSQPFVLIFSEDSNNHSRSSLKASKKNTHSGIHDLLQTKTEQDAFYSDKLSQEASSTDSFLHDRRKRSLIKSSESSTLIPSRNDSCQNLLKSLQLFLNSGSFLKVRDLEILQTAYNITQLSTYFNRCERLKENFKGHLSSLTLHIMEKLFLFNISRNSLKNIWRETLSSLLKHDKLSKEFPLDTSNSNVYKVLLCSFEKQLTNFSKYTNISQRMKYGIKRNKSDAPWRLKKRKRSISNESSVTGTSKELIPTADTTANTFQTIGEKYASHLNSTMSLPRRQNRQRSRSFKKSNKRKKKKRRRNPKLPFWWTGHDNRLHSQDYSKICQRKSLVVDFVKLGWGDWVMSPKSFNAHYCSGSCSFPLIKNANPSNHAAIQSLVHAIGLSPNVPTPCCVPSASSPLTLLYFDEHGNLVLKNYPNMIVEKCACR